MGQDFVGSASQGSVVFEYSGFMSLLKFDGKC